MNDIPWRKSSYSRSNGTNCVEVATWRKSTYSSGNGTDCVEVATWRKSTHSGSNGADCVEAGISEPGHVLVRDTANRSGATLAFTTEAWQRFTATLS
jgi:Domain of unknown function (DUF397)